MLVWSEDDGGIARRGSAQVAMARGKRFQKLGQSLFLVSGVESRADGRRRRAGRAAAAGRRRVPASHAEAILAAARQSGDRDKEATALTDLGVIP